MNKKFEQKTNLAYALSLASGILILSTSLVSTLIHTTVYTIDFDETYHCPMMHIMPFFNGIFWFLFPLGIVSGMVVLVASVLLT